MSRTETKTTHISHAGRGVGTRLILNLLKLVGAHLLMAIAQLAPMQNTHGQTSVTDNNAQEE